MRTDVRGRVGVRCDCGAPVEFADEGRPARDAPDPRAFDARRGLWSFAEFLPVGPRVTLGEGTTPLVDALEWDAAFKLEYVSPAGSSRPRTTWSCRSREAA